MADLWRGIAAAGGARLYGLLAGMATLVLTARVLGPQGRGEVAAALTWAALLATVGYLSLGQVALHSAAGDRDETWLSRHLGSLALVTVVVSLVGWAGAAGAYVVTGGALFGDLPAGVLALGLAGLPLLVWEHYGSSLLMALDRLRLYNRAQVLGRTAGLLLAGVLVVVLDLGVLGALSAILLAQGVVAAAGAGELVRAAGGRVRPHRATTRALVGGGLKLHLNAVGTFLFTGASVLVVQYYRGAEETGHFQLALQLTAVALVIPQAATMVLYSQVARDGPDAAWTANRHVLLGMTGLMAVLAVAGGLLAPWLVPVFVGGDFRPAVPVLQLLLLALVGQSFSTVLAPQWIGRGLFWQAAAASLATGVVSLLVCFVLVPEHGMYGAAYAHLGVYTLSILGNGAFAVWVSRRARPSRPPAPLRVQPADGA